MPKIELTAVFYLDIPDEVDPDEVTLEIDDDGNLYFEVDGEEVATTDDIEGYETLEVDAADDDDDDEV
jgi:hypothetical protein